MHDGDVHILLGKVGTSWAPFGGVADVNERSLDAAARECHEESRGVISLESAHRLLHRATRLSTQTPRGYKFDLYVAAWKGDHNDVITKFRGAPLDGMAACYQEMTDIRWFALSTLREGGQRLRAPFRRDLYKVERVLCDSATCGCRSRVISDYKPSCIT
jgi:ADP-ribose pyrophosphatase YjhB (NUDIX family)